MSILLRHAEEILEIAVRGEKEVAIVIDRQGGVCMMDPAGWSLPSLRQEYGAGFVYKVERHAGMLRVEGWDGAQRCVLQRPLARRPVSAYLPGMPELLPAAPRRLALGDSGVERLHEAHGL